MSAACITAPPEALGPALRSILPDGIAFAMRDPRIDHGPLPPCEAAALGRASPARRREFSAGRCAARQAMAALGVAPCAVPQGPDRAPVWPSSIAGTISHAAGCCIALAARRAQFRSLGVDIEPAEPLEAALAESICTRQEMADLAALPKAERGLRARLIFSAKECAYKAQYPLSRKLLEFDALEIGIDAAASAFHARFTRTVAPFAAGTRLQGRVIIRSGLILTAMALPA